jgi:cysteine desulfurase
MGAAIYLDNNATTPILPEVVAAMQACHDQQLYNPASQHEFGRRARRVLEDARERVAELLGAKTGGRDDDRVIFTSGGTEANNLAILGLLEARLAGDTGTTKIAPPRVVVSAVEHPSITALADELSRREVAVDWVGVDAQGVIRVQELENLIRPETRLVTTMLGQNETGVLQPVAEIAAICRAAGVPLHTDAAQVVGKLPVDFRALGVTTMSVAAHKFHGPLGIGALVVRHGTDLRPQLFGGFQQAAARPGTESVALAVGMRTALERWHAERDERLAHLRTLRDGFEETILGGWPAAVIVGGRAKRLPQTSSIAFVGLDRQALFMALDQAGVACSTGSACASGSSERSPALVAMGLNRAILDSTLRFSFSALNSLEEAREAARRILTCCKELGRKN